MKIDVLCSYHFPEGMAPTTRIIAYCKGLLQNNVSVEVVSFERITSKDSKRVDGVVDGIPYHIPFCYNPRRYNNRLHRVLWDNWRLRFSCIRQIVQSNRKQKIDYVLCSFDNPLSLMFYSISLRLCGIRVGFIGDEFPEAIRQLKNKVPAWQVILYKLAYKFIDLRVLMTKALQDYYDREVCPKPTYILSSVIDTSRFDNIIRKVSTRDYLCYMGNMMLAKDNVDNIIEAFSMIVNEFDDVDLFLYGIPSENDRKIVEDLIAKHNLTTRVIMKGRASYTEVPQILVNAKILVTSQPLTMRAQGGFPTKMCEYMMTGVPTILTDVGEIHDYVKDGDTVYMVEACNPVKYAEKLKYILTHYHEALNVAANAKELVINIYGSQKATEGLVDFFNLQKMNLRHE